MNRQQRPITDRKLMAWLAAGPVDRGVGEGPTFVASTTAALARQDRARIERGIDVAAARQAEKALLLEVPTVQRLGEVRFAKYIQPRYWHPEVVARVLRKHI